MGRYNDSTTYEFGKARGASQSPGKVYDAVKSGQINAEVYILKEGQRIDTIAGEVYGDSTMWWVIAAASGIGWPLQVPPGTRILIPDKVQLNKVI